VKIGQPEGALALESGLTHGSLFSGIGGFDLGFERAGIKTVWQVEIDGYCRRVLAKHFPKAKRFEDITQCFGQHARFEDSRKDYLPYVDILSGGFPCQDISNAGKRAGIDGERSGLWSEYARIIREIRPRFVVVENVAALLGRGMGRVLGDLAAIGYDAEWDCISAAAVGAPHLRERIWIVAHDVRSRLEGDGPPTIFTAPFPFQSIRWVGLSESSTLRKRNAVPNFVDRIRGLGNAVIPQIAEYIGYNIVAVEEQIS
jgi:DNA (cytosine-5)-methyltransferase 1